MIPDRPDNLLEDAGRLAQAMDTHWFWDGVNPETKQDLQNKVEQLREAVRVDTSARTTRDLATKRLALADKTMRKWLTNARLVVMLARGARWSESWIQTGFTDAKMRVPKQLDQRIALARSLVSFFARHPEFSVGFAEITAARGRAIYERVIQSSEMLQMTKQDCVATGRSFRSARRDVQHMLRSVVPALKSKIASKRRERDLTVKRRRPVRRGRAVGPVRPSDPIPFVQETACSSQGVVAA